MPEIFGLHDNANITFAQNETFALLGAIIQLQPKTSTAGGQSREEVCKPVACLANPSVPIPKWSAIDRQGCGYTALPQRWRTWTLNGDSKDSWLLCCRNWQASSPHNGCNSMHHKCEGNAYCVSNVGHWPRTHPEASRGSPAGLCPRAHNLHAGISELRRVPESYLQCFPCPIELHVMIKIMQNWEGGDFKLPNSFRWKNSTLFFPTRRAWIAWMWKKC